jgi:hypothetical protein
VFPWSRPGSKISPRTREVRHSLLHGGDDSGKSGPHNSDSSMRAQRWDTVAVWEAGKAGPARKCDKTKENGREVEWVERGEKWRWARNEGRGPDKLFPFSFSFIFYFSCFF